ncbi:MAG: hypothetical protein ACT6S0_20140 [Roseateles sp.]|uniref:hypothetical protein n=1 Tax=Roseateles sp. TaxID=1971397 RepID=UPI0040372CFB
MNDLSEQHIDELLRSGFEGAVADDGFSAQVMSALPQRRRLRAALVPGAALVGGLLAWLSLLPTPLVQGAASEWLAGDVGASLVVMHLVLLGLGLLSCAWALEEESA